jgi:thiosulfate/3-mercaptopyruvate sulfurtransferase
MATDVSKISGLLLILASLAIIFTGCKKTEEDEQPPVVDVATCEGCHINYAHLQEVYSPDTTAPPGGCGGSVPHYEPYDRVYMGGDGYETFKASGHYDIGCVGCHNGTDNTDDKNLAHSGDFIAHPSMFYEDKCGDCHQSIVDNFKTSLHHGTGQKRKVAMRSGLSGPEEFDLLPESHKEGYAANCATCHGTCGNCHIVRPLTGGGGLMNGHAFNKTPDMINVCVTCHTSRGGHAYLGVAPGTQPDVHLTSAGFDCMDCHTGSELHGDGQPVDHRYAYDKLPDCEDCHGDLSASNTYHTVHYADFNCQVCHSQDYNNCGSCHIDGEGARIPSYMDFKIAANPIPDVKTDYDLALVRRTLAAPDNWQEFGIEEYADFNAFPTYNYTTPHNLKRWTSRTMSARDRSCSSSCHIRNEGGTLVNRELYLFMDDLLWWEVDATSHITVDDKLPPSWFEE